MHSMPHQGCSPTRPSLSAHSAVLSGDLSWPFNLCYLGRAGNCAFAHKQYSGLSHLDNQPAPFCTRITNHPLSALPPSPASSRYQGMTHRRARVHMLWAALAIPAGMLHPRTASTTSAAPQAVAQSNSTPNRTLTAKSNFPAAAAAPRVPLLTRTSPVSLAGQQVTREPWLAA
jgi:hypothetical protein